MSGLLWDYFAPPEQFQGPLHCLWRRVRSGRSLGTICRVLPLLRINEPRKEPSHAEAMPRRLRYWDFRKGDIVILAVVKYDYERGLIYGRILSEW